MCKSKMITLLFVFLFLAGPAQAEEENFKKKNNADKTYISLSVENDNFGGNSDRYYTSGVRLTWFNAGTPVPPVIDKMADRIPTFDLNETTSTVFTIGQNIYTPKDIRIAAQQNDDRPWAGFLYGSVGLMTITQNDSIPPHVDELEFTLGVVGPPSFGEQAQKFVHEHLTDSPEPQGWDHQLKTEPGIIISWQRRMPFALSWENEHFFTRIEPHFGLSLGNIYTYAETGATLVLGSSELLDIPPRVRPAMPGTGVFLSPEGHAFDWQLFAGLNGRVVGRNIFLDGNSFANSHSVDKKYLVGDASAGISFIYDDYRLSYSLNARSEEFHGQDEQSIFGSVSLSTRF